MLKRLKANRKQQREQQQQQERCSRFLEAARFGDLEKLLELIRSNVDVNTKNENDLYALHLAAKEGHVEVTKELLKRGALVDAVTKKGNSALHLACLAGQLEAVRVLVENGSNINLRSQNGFTPLYMAAQENNEHAVKLLLGCGADATIGNDDGFLPLDVAIQQGHGKLVASLLENDPSNAVALPALHVAAKKNDIKTTSFLLDNGFAVDTPSKSGFSALHIAARYGNYEACKALIDKGADVNWKAKNEITPLHVSSREGHSSVVELLLNSGAQSDSQTAEGLTALHCAAVNGHDQVLDSLVRSGASLSSKTKNGLTPLHMALQGNQASCTRQLLQYNAPIDDTTEDDLTPLHVAAHCGNLRSAQILLDSGCDVNTKARNGFTSLHVACVKSHQEMVGLLLQHDANIKAASDSGLCSLHIAAFLGHLEVAASLIQHGASVDVATKKGMTPLYLATLSNKMEMIKFLLQSGATVDAGTVDQRTALHVASELGNAEDVRLLLEHGASPGVKTVDEFRPLDFAARTGNREIVRLLLEHGAIEGEESFQKHPSPGSSSLAEFSMIRDELKYMKGVEIDIKTPKLKRKPREEAGKTSAPRSKPCGRDSRLSHIASSLSLSESPSASFWSSFLTDARGGEMVGCRHSGVRIILPPSKVPRPMGITCKLIRKEKLPCLPPVKEGEALACRALETSPAGSRFLGPVVFEVPHFASLRGKEREIAVLRSDNGRSWSEHTVPPFDDIGPTLQNALLNEMMRQNSSLVHIITVDLPRFFALISRIRMEHKDLSDDGGSMVSTLVPKVKISFPEDSCLRETKIGLQAQPIQPEMVSKFLGDQAMVSPIVTIEPRRRKFHHPISVTIPTPDSDSQASRRNLKLLCSISKGNNPALWEDITDLAALTSAKELVSFTTSVSGKYWFLDSPDLNTKMLADVQKLYSMAIAVPFLSKFVVFAKRLSLDEGRLRIFCMTDDKVDKTLERQEQFVEVARSDDVEVLEGTAQYINLQGNLLPIGDFKDDQLQLNFHAFRENRLPIAVRVTDPSQEARGIVTFTRDSGIRNSWSEICSLEVTLPKFWGETQAAEWKAPSVTNESQQDQPSEEPQIQKAELRLTDIAELIGREWKPLAGRLGIIPEEVEEIVGTDNATPNAEALAMLQQWVQKNGSDANGNNLERALRDLGRDDIIASCMCNVADVTDSKEKAAARNYLDSGVDPLKAEIGSVQDLGSSRATSVRHSMSPDSAYGEENTSKMSFTLPGAHGGYDHENKYFEDMFRESRVGEQFPFIDRSLSTVSTNTLTTLPSDGDTTRYQSIDEISSEDQTVLRAEMEEEEDERMLEDGSCVRRKVVTVRHLKRRHGSEDALVGVEVEEDTLELAPGVELPLGEDVDVERHVENFVENLSGGVWKTRKVTTTKARKILSTEEVSDVPDDELEDVVSRDFPESKAKPTSDLDFVDDADFLPKESGENLPVEVEEELVEAKTRPVFCSRPRLASGWRPKVSSEDEIEKETIIKGLEGKPKDTNDDGISISYTNVYEGPKIEPNISRVILENGERNLKKLSLVNKGAGTHLTESNIGQDQNQQGCYPTTECMDENETNPTCDGVSAGGKEPQDKGMKDAFDISLRQFTEKERDAVRTRPFDNTDDKKDSDAVGELRALELPESTIKNLSEHGLQSTETSNKTSDENATMQISSKDLKSGYEHEMLNLQKETDMSMLSARNIQKAEPDVASFDSPLSSVNAQWTQPDKIECAESVTSVKTTLPARMPAEFAETLSSAEQRLADEATGDLSRNALLGVHGVTDEIPSRSEETTLLSGLILVEQSECAESGSRTKQAAAAAGGTPYESTDTVLSAEQTKTSDTESRIAETVSTTDQQVADESEVIRTETSRDVFSRSPDYTLRVTEAGTGYVAADITGLDVSKEVLSGYLEEYRPCISETGAECLEAEAERVDESKVFSRYPDEYRVNIPEAGSGYLETELTKTVQSEEVFRGHEEGRLHSLEVSSEYDGQADVAKAGVSKETFMGYPTENRSSVLTGGSEHLLNYQTTTTESSKDVFDKHLDENRPCISEAESLGAKVTRLEPLQAAFSGYPEEYKPSVAEDSTSTGHLAAEMIRAETSQDVYAGHHGQYRPHASDNGSGYLAEQRSEPAQGALSGCKEQYRPCITEADSGYLGAEEVRAELSQVVFSGHPEAYRPCITETDTECLGAEKISAETSSEVFSRYPEESTLRVAEDGTEYQGADGTKTDVPKEVLSGHLEEYRPWSSEADNEHLEAEMERANESKAFSSYPDEHRVYIPESGSEYQGVEKAMVDESKEVFSGHPQEYRPSVPEVVSDYLDPEDSKTMASKEVSTRQEHRQHTPGVGSEGQNGGQTAVAESGTEFLGAGVTRAETAKETFSVYPGEGRPCAMDAGAGYLGSELTMAETSGDDSPGHPEQYRTGVTEHDSGYLGADVTKTDVPKEVLSGRLEEYRPWSSEADNEHLEADMERANESKAFSSYPDEHRVYIPGSGSEYHGVEKAMVDESKEVFSGHPQEYRPSVPDVVSDYLDPEGSKTMASKEVSTRQEEHSKYTSDVGSKYQNGGQTARAESCTEFLGAEVTRDETAEESPFPISGRDQLANPIQMNTESLGAGRESGTGNEIIELLLSSEQLEYQSRMEVKAGNEEFSTGGTEIRNELAPDSIHVLTRYPDAGRTIEIEQRELVRRYPDGSDLAVGFNASSSGYPDHMTEIEPTEISGGYQETSRMQVEDPAQAYLGYSEAGKGIEIDSVELTKGYPINLCGMKVAVDLKVSSTGYPESAVSGEYAVQPSDSEMGFPDEKLSMVYPETGMGVAVDQTNVSSGYLEAGQTALATPSQTLVPEGVDGYRGLEATDADLSKQPMDLKCVKNEASIGFISADPALGKSLDPDSPLNTAYPVTRKCDAVYSEWQNNGSSEPLEPNDSSLETLTPINSAVHLSTPNTSETQTFKAEDTDGQTFKGKDSDDQTSATQFWGFDISPVLNIDQLEAEMETRRARELTSHVFAASAAPQIIAGGEDLDKRERFLPQLPDCKTFKDKEESTADGKAPHEKLTRVILRRCVHKKTIITGCQEETMVTEDTHVEQDNETPRELNHAIRLIIEQFVLGESNFDTAS